VIFRYDLDKLREVPGVPFSHSHRESVDCFVQLIENCNRLNNVVIIALNRELDLGSGVGMTQTQLSSVQITLPERLEQFGCMHSNSAKHILDNFTSISGLAVDRRECGLDARSKHSVVHPQANLLLLACLGKI
jgi:hypothetical protein